MEMDVLAGLISSGAGATGRLASSFYSNKSEKMRARLEKQAAEHKARLAELQAEYARFKGQKEAGRLTLASGNLLGRQRASQAAANIDLSVGSAAEVRAGTEFFKDADRFQLEQNALMDAWGYRSQASDYSFVANNTRANSAASAVIPTLITGANTVADTWAKLLQTGVIGNKQTKSDDPLYALYQLNNGWK